MSSIRVLILAGLAGLVTSPAQAQVLLQQSDLVYQGAFRLPAGTGTKSFSYGGTALTHNPTSGTLYLVGHDWDQLTAEIDIPQIVNSTTLSALKTAKLLQPFVDSLEGKIGSINPPDTNSKKIGGQLVHGGKLIVAAYSYYDGAATQSSSHFTRPPTLATTGQLKGPFKVGSLGPRYLAGYLTPIPQQWQAALGGPALTGQCCLSIISTTSLGPAAFVFDPADLGTKNPVPATPLVYYTTGHPTLGTWSGNGTPNPVYNMGTQVTGIAFPSGTRSVLFFGTTGLGKPCYGEGTSNQSLDGKPVPSEPGVIYCYDPDVSSKGTHAYPYSAYVWAYDVNELLTVKSGAKNPWDIKPYASWALKLPFGSSAIKGAAYDAAAGRIFLSQGFADGDQPVIHAFTVAASAPPDGGIRDLAATPDGRSPDGSVRDSSRSEQGAREAGTSVSDGQAGAADRRGAEQGAASQSSGCSCSTTADPELSLLGAALLLAAVLIRRRRARSAQS